jgi:hypothetical protein
MLCFNRSQGGKPGGGNLTAFRVGGARGVTDNICPLSLCFVSHKCPDGRDLGVSVFTWALFSGTTFII